MRPRRLAIRSWRSLGGRRPLRLGLAGVGASRFLVEARGEGAAGLDGGLEARGEDLRRERALEHQSLGRRHGSPVDDVLGTRDRGRLRGYKEGDEVRYLSGLRWPSDRDSPE